MKLYYSMKYFIKIASLTDQVNKAIETDNSEDSLTTQVNSVMSYDGMKARNNSEAVDKLVDVFKEIGERKPMGAGKNPDPTSKHIWTGGGFPIIR